MVSMKHIPLVSTIVLGLTSHVTADFIEDNGLEARGEDFLNDGLLLETRDDLDERDVWEELEVRAKPPANIPRPPPNRPTGVGYTHGGRGRRDLDERDVWEELEVRAKPPANIPRPPPNRPTGVGYTHGGRGRRDLGVRAKPPANIPRPPPNRPTGVGYTHGGRGRRDLDERDVWEELEVRAKPPANIPRPPPNRPTGVGYTHGGRGVRGRRNIETWLMAQNQSDLPASVMPMQAENKQPQEILMFELSLLLISLVPLPTDLLVLVTLMEVEAEEISVFELSLLPIFLARHQTDLPALDIPMEAEAEETWERWRTTSKEDERLGSRKNRPPRLGLFETNSTLTWISEFIASGLRDGDC
ncbi:unnamed protein product [Clonostachys solani]|uniref:Uncharacterized protein n=1 Tax=Clonostachys solani TaxID=160281 RepID=A0A9N9ZI57_9HYPO|nr:unnamed protein product [Clonostachys solani]